MLLELIAGGPLLLVAVHLCRIALRLRQNWLSARASGYPYTFVPVHLLSPVGFAIAPLLTFALAFAPDSLKKPWAALIDFRKLWHIGRTPFEDMGCETFIAVCPGGNVVWTCDPEAFAQVTRSCANPTGMKDAWTLYGPTIPVAQGQQWRTYRKVIAPSFSEATHGQVWRTALNEVQLMLAQWPETPAGGKIVARLQPSVEDLMLHVASEVLYGRVCRWDAEKSDPSKRASEKRPMSYDAAIKGMVQNLYTVFFTPKAILRYIPSSTFRKASAAFQDWGYHMRNLRDTRNLRMTLEKQSGRNDLLGALVRAQMDGVLEPDEVTGNMFFTLVAAHETSSNILCFALAALAALPALQSELQDELDRVLPSSDPASWTYKGECSALLDGYAGAVIFETLRLWTSLPALIKSNEGPRQTLSLKEGRLDLEHGTEVLLHVTAAHNHPLCWVRPQTGDLGSDHLPYPLSDFHPRRWFRENANFESPFMANTGRAWIDEMDPNSDRKRRLLHVPHGLFSPFSEGPTACLGSRMAMVELVASMAYICKQWNVRAPLGPLQQGLNNGSMSQNTAEALSRAKLIKQITQEVSFNLVVQTKEPVSLELMPRS